MKLFTNVTLKIKILKLKFWLWRKGISYLTPVVGYSENEFCVIYGRFSGFYANTSAGYWEVAIEAIHSEKRTGSMYKGSAVYCYEIKKITEKELQDWCKIENEG